MQSIHENINYSEKIVCPHCSTQIEYHVIDIKGVEEKYVICWNCRNKIPVK